MMRLVNAENKTFVEFLTDSLYRYFAGRGFLLPRELMVFSNRLFSGHFNDEQTTDRKCMKNVLNPSQKNSLRVTLLRFEENLRHAQDWLDGHEENGILYHRKLIFSEEGKEEIRQEIKAALELIENLSRKFDLTKEEINSASVMRGELTTDWANLLNTRASKMGRFGDVQPELASLLDEDIQNLAGIALYLSSILTETQQESP
jgi:hypothetical protein